MDPHGVPRDVQREAAAAAAAAAAAVAPPPSPSACKARLLHPGDRVSKRFRVLRLLNSGGCAEVYEAVDETTGEHVGIFFFFFFLFRSGDS